MQILKIALVGMLMFSLNAASGASETSVAIEQPDNIISPTSYLLGTWVLHMKAIDFGTQVAVISTSTSTYDAARHAIVTKDITKEYYHARNGSLHMVPLSSQEISG